MEQGERICRRCLIREMAGQEKVYETLQEYMAQIEPKDRADEELYEERLGRCRGCERLLEGMCRACGCYVELRAAKLNNKCPYQVW